VSFAHPQLLWLLLVIPPALAVFLWWSSQCRRRLLSQFIEARLLPGLLAGVSESRRKLRLGCLVAAVTLTLVALARPQWGFTWEESRQKGLDIVVAIDTSKSMLAEDITPNRLQRAKLAALDLMKLASADRLGLVAFAGSAFLQCPLTIDDNAFRQSLELLNVNLIPQGGTAIAEAIRVAQSAFKEGDNFQVLVLFSDGEDNDEGALAAAQTAAKDGMKIFTIGIGTPDGELLRIKDAKGRLDYIRDTDGNVVKSRLNEGLLQEIAGATDGAYYRLTGAKTIDSLYEQFLAPLPKSEGQEKLVKRMHERYHWPLALAILLLLVEKILPERRSPMRRVPIDAKKDVSVQTAVPTAGLLLLGLMLPATASASPSSALRQYESGRYDAALREYQAALEKRPDDPRLQFNAGAAAYRDGNYEQAARHFGEALSAPDLQLQEQAYYNLGNTLYRAGEQAASPPQAQEAWKQAIQQYERALKLNPNHADAQFNREFVQQRLEELQQQQQQQKNQDQSDQKQDQSQDQQQPDQPPQEQKDQEQQNQQPQDQPDQSEQEQSRPNESAKEKDQPDPQAAKSNGEEESPDDQQLSQPLEAQAMTPQEAERLLDAQKGEEKVLQFAPQGEPRQRDRRFKDW